MTKNIAILMGGYSSEYPISINSGNVVYEALKDTYNCYRVIITKERWYALNHDENEITLDKSDFSITISNEKLFFDAAFNTIHGTPGEDGHIQGYLSLLGIPQSSCDLYQSALTFNKRDLLSVLKPYGIPMATSVYFNQGDKIETKAIVEKVGLPCFVKANKSGSSFGVTKVYKEEDINNAIDIALEHDNEVFNRIFFRWNRSICRSYNLPRKNKGFTYNRDCF